jgi:hypothetical protein
MDYASDAINAVCGFAADPAFKEYLDQRKND